jgi:hypothetical protein
MMCHVKVLLQEEKSLGSKGFEICILGPLEGL